MAFGGSDRDLPTLAEQVAFWDRWNQEFRSAEIDSFMARQRDIAVQVATAERLRDARILDAGCGTGWLSHALLPFGKVTGTDLSPSSIAHGRKAFPGSISYAATSSTWRSTGHSISSYRPT